MAVKLESPKAATGRGGGKLSRSETVTVRLDPKLRYLAELAARKQRRTLSSFIEWAIEDTLRRFPIDEGPSGDTTVMAVAEQLWDVDEADRFAKLAIRYPELLSHEEQILWKLIKENGYFWAGNYNGYGGTFRWTIDESSLIFPRVRDKWQLMLQIAAGDMLESEMPAWVRVKPATRPPAASPKPTTDFSDMDDDIPF